jgi:hypothetical protein
MVLRATKGESLSKEPPIDGLNGVARPKELESGRGTELFSLLPLPLSPDLPIHRESGQPNRV